MNEETKMLRTWHGDYLAPLEVGQRAILHTTENGQVSTSMVTRIIWQSDRGAIFETLHSVHCVLKKKMPVNLLAK